MRKKIVQLIKKLPDGKLKRAICWYVLGNYHCDKCEMCWSDWSDYLGDGDAGCYIFGDLRDTCRLPKPIRLLWGYTRKKKAEYGAAHCYDDMGKFVELEEDRRQAFSESILILLRDKEVYTRSWEDGTLVPVCKMELTDQFDFGVSSFSKAYRHYESKAHPVSYMSLKEEWKRLWERTKKEFYEEHIAPFRSDKKKKGS